jgi:hypothetical protein
MKNENPQISRDHFLRKLWRWTQAWMSHFGIFQRLSWNLKVPYSIPAMINIIVALSRDFLDTFKIFSEMLTLFESWRCCTSERRHFARHWALFDRGPLPRTSEITFCQYSVTRRCREVIWVHYLWRAISFQSTHPTRWLDNSPALSKKLLSVKMFRRWSGSHRAATQLRAFAFVGKATNRSCWKLTFIEDFQLLRTFLSCRLFRETTNRTKQILVKMAQTFISSSSPSGKLRTMSSFGWSETNRTSFEIGFWSQWKRLHNLTNSVLPSCDGRFR